jgi:hypothetical protein
MLPAEAPYSFEWNCNRFSFHLSVTGINQLISFYFDQESPILLSGTITGYLFICSKKVRYAASVCSSVVPSGLDLFIAQLMNLVETPCFLGQCSRPRLLACFGSRRVPRSAALLPGCTQHKKINVGRRGTNQLRLLERYLVLCWLT